VHEPRRDQHEHADEHERRREEAALRGRQRGEQVHAESVAAKASRDRADSITNAALMERAADAENGSMGLLRAHLAAVAIVLAAVLATTGVFLFARPMYHPYQMPKPPSDGLDYTSPRYNGADARRAFAHAGIALSHAVPSPGIVGFFNRELSLEVTVFGDRKLVDSQGFSDYYTFVDGHWELAPKSCVKGARNAERWHVNVRVIVSCDPGAAATLQRASLALAALR
jgi:hypothetical protein